MAELDHALEQAVLAGVAANAANEGPFNLQFVERQAIEIRQGGIASAKIIDRQFDANAFEAFKNGLNPHQRSVSEQAFGNLKA